MSGRKGPTRSTAKTRQAPLRKIVEVLRHAESAYDTQKVLLDCGHVMMASGGAIYRARCWKCAPVAAPNTPSERSRNV